VAIKKISGCFESPVDAKRMLREVKLLSHLRHENVIGLRDLLPPPSPSAAAYKVMAAVLPLLLLLLAPVLLRMSPSTGS
jgi:mitogen-activated protein kinase 1/3